MRPIDEDVAAERERSRRFVEIVYGSMALTSAVAAIWFQNWAPDAGVPPDKASGAALAFLVLGLGNLIILALWPRFLARLNDAADRIGQDRD